MDQEQADFLGRACYERKGTPRGHCNGYASGGLATAEGRLDIVGPQVRGAEVPFRSGLLAFLGKHTGVLERLVVETKARGLSTRDVEEAFTDVTGARLPSKSGVSKLTDGAPGLIRAVGERSGDGRR